MGDVKPHHSLGVEKKFADNGPGSGSDENARMRLLHAVQRERGVTCGWVASSGAQPWNDLHVELRRATDERDAASDVRQKLVEMRAAADASVGGAPRRKLAEVALGTQPTVAADFYTAFTSYNALCEQILTRPAAQALRDADGEAVEAEPWRRQAKDNALGAGWAVPMLAFARLKNWHGVERAFLCGVLALPDDAVASLPSRAFADLVIGLQQQRNQEAIVREAVPPKLLEMVSAGFEYAPALAKVQQRLLEDFDVSRLRGELSAERAWQLTTEHIDKLEKLQALLSYEWAKKDGAHADANAATAVRQVAVALLGERGASREAAAAAAERVAALPAEQLKSAVLRALTARAREGSPDASPASHSPASGSPKVRSTKPDTDTDDDAAAAAKTEAETAVPTEATKGGALRIGIDELVFVKRIGGGASGSTYLAQWSGTPVAFKLSAGNSLDSWRNEAAQMAGLRHENIVRCFGVVVTPPTFGLVLEYCERRDLSELLGGPTPANMAEGFVLRVASHVAAGMHYLHAQGIMHRDLKSANVLLDATGVAKVTDFGLASRAPDDTMRGGSLTAETGTYRWMAPEVIRHERYSKKADVFSFGMILFELLTHQLPFADLAPLQAAVSVALNDERPPLPDGCPAPLARLVASCWASDRGGRPAFSWVAEAVAALPDQLSDEEAAWLDDPLGHSVYSDTSVEGRSSSFRLREGAVPPTTPGHVLAEPPSGSSASSGHRRSDSGGPSSFRRSASALKSVVTRSLFGWSGGPDGA